MTLGIGKRAKLVLEVIQLLPVMDTGVIEEVAYAATHVVHALASWRAWRPVLVSCHACVIFYQRSISSGSRSYALCVTPTSMASR
jgi:hypothetical protein